MGFSLQRHIRQMTPLILSCCEFFFEHMHVSEAAVSHSLSGAHSPPDTLFEGPLSQLMEGSGRSN